MINSKEKKKIKLPHSKNNFLAKELQEHSAQFAKPVTNHLHSLLEGVGVSRPQFYSSLTKCVIKLLHRKLLKSLEANRQIKIQMRQMQHLSRCFKMVSNKNPPKFLINPSPSFQIR